MWRVTAYDRDNREVGRLEVPGGEITIGRDPDRRLVLPSASVSRRHARLVLDGPQPYVMDEGSANGVIVNGVRIAAPTAIVPGIRVDIADFHLEFEQGPRATEAVSPISAPVPQVPMQMQEQPADEVMRFVAEGGPFDGRIFEVPLGEAGVGRAVDNDIVIDDPSLSRKHARVRRIGPGKLELEDLGSSNGTYVNGRKVGRGAAAPGDSVRFGELTFRLEGSSGSGTRYNQPSGGGGNTGLVIGAVVGGLLLIVGVVALILVLRKSGPGKDTAAADAEKVAQLVRSGRDKLADKKFEAAASEFAEALRIDPANVEARRLKLQATSEPDNERLAKSVGVKSDLGDRAGFEVALRFFGQIPQESVFRTPAAQKLTRKLVSFAETQCKARKWADCAWAVCKTYDVVPEDGKPPADAITLMKDAEKKLAKDKSFTPCKKR